MKTREYRKVIKKLLYLDPKGARKEFLETCVPLYKAALKGDWENAERIIGKDRTILSASITEGWHTALHLAAGTRNVQFVEDLVKIVNKEELELQDQKGNTPFCFAAAAGDVQIAEIMIRKNENLALQMFEDDASLATARDKNDMTALHILARMPPSTFSKQGSTIRSNLIRSCMKSRCKSNLKQNKALELVRCLWKQVLNLEDEKLMDLINSPSKLLFDAATVGNFEFLAVLVNSYPDLLWETDDLKSIIHVAVLHRHANIFNLIHDVGSLKEFVGTSTDFDGNNILHLAAKLPSKDRLNIVSGAALQMQRELLWFEEVKKIVQPQNREMKNKKGKTPQQLFSKEHKRLMKSGESWLIDTAKSCLIVSTLIVAVVFAAAFTVPGSNKHNKTPPLIVVFALSDGLALFSSSTAIIMFLSILTSRYSEKDFLKSLPSKLMIGLVSLFISILTMMNAFSTSFVIAYRYGLSWVPFFIIILVFPPVLSFIFLLFPLLFDIFISTYSASFLFRAHRNVLH
ncbi:hypothetical protein UlMin_019204 [Ulmus minor]